MLKRCSFRCLGFSSPGLRRSAISALLRTSFRERERERERKGIQIVEECQMRPWVSPPTQLAGPERWLMVQETLDKHINYAGLVPYKERGILTCIWSERIKKKKKRETVERERVVHWISINVAFLQGEKNPCLLEMTFQKKKRRPFLRYGLMLGNNKA